MNNKISKEKIERLYYFSQVNPLLHAIETKNNRIIKDIVINENVKNNGTYIIFFNKIVEIAAENKDLELLECLLDDNIEKRKTIVTIAINFFIKMSYLEGVKKCIEYGFEIKERINTYILYRCATYQKIDFLIFFLEYNNYIETIDKDILKNILRRLSSRNEKILINKFNIKLTYCNIL